MRESIHPSRIYIHPSIAHIKLLSISQPFDHCIQRFRSENPRCALQCNSKLTHSFPLANTARYPSVPPRNLARASCHVIEGRGGGWPVASAAPAPCASSSATAIAAHRLCHSSRGPGLIVAGPPARWSSTSTSSSWDRSAVDATRRRRCIFRVFRSTTSPPRTPCRSANKASERANRPLNHQNRALAARRD